MAVSPTARSARRVAAGILLSRIAGLVRTRVFAHYFGTSLYADVFNAALRMPNVLQNLLGEGTLSASFIPVYSELLGQKRESEAGRVAGALFALLLAIAGALALLGIVLAPVLVDVFLPGFAGTRRALTIASVRIIFPMTGILVLSAWALGILNSHRRFFVPYVAPVLWNAAMIGTLVWLGRRLDPGALVVALAWGALAGGLLQLAIQLPWVLRLERQLRVRWDLRLAGMRQVLRSAGPAVLGRGVVQLSGWVDLVLASLLSFGAVAALGYAQTLYLLPISLFGMSVAAAELPELARARAAPDAALRERINAGLRRIAFFVVPTTVGYLTVGDLLVGALYETGSFGRDDTRFVSVVLAGYALALLPSTATRLYSSAFFALRDTSTPAKYALVRVLLAGALGLALMFPLERVILEGHALGVAGLSIGTGLAAWLEWSLLRRVLRGRVGAIGVGTGPLARMCAAALAAAVVVWGARGLLAPAPPLFAGGVAVAGFAAVYFAAAAALGLREARALLRLDE